MIPICIMFSLGSGEPRSKWHLGLSPIIVCNMARYLRWFVPGGTYFFTVVTYRRQPIFRDPKARDLLHRSFEEVQQRRPFFMEGLVLLPDRLHCVWALPEGDTDYSTRWRKIKEGFTRAYLARGGASRAVSASQAAKGLRGVWQQRFWEHTIRDERDFGRHMDYIHFNPVKHGYAKCPHDWPWSTLRKWIAEGVYDQQWLCACGERRVSPPMFEEIAASAME